MAKELFMLKMLKKLNIFRGILFICYIIHQKSKSFGMKTSFEIVLNIKFNINVLSCKEWLLSIVKPTPLLYVNEISNHKINFVSLISSTNSCC